ncbi:hypothetical protein [Escherichia coli]
MFTKLAQSSIKAMF